MNRSSSEVPPSLISLAKQTLLRNRREGFTIPTAKLYPFQWNWDSGFICLGYSHFDVQLAIEELESLFSGQWANGMIPHILFHHEHEDSYFPNHNFWQADVNSGSPSTVKTSGITQPPVHGFILESLYQQHPGHPKMQQLVNDLFPKIMRSHQFFYKQRDPMREGLAYIYHPWESGRDNSPVWDPPIQQIEIDQASLPPYQRKDTALINAQERPTQDKYDRYVFLLETGKRHAYEGQGIFEESPFLVQDVMLNAILIRSNEALIRLGKDFGYDTNQLQEWQEKSKRAFQKLWNDDLGMYTSYDLRKKEQLVMPEIGGLIPLFAGIPGEKQANRMQSYLKILIEQDFRLCPSFGASHPLFDPKRYWRGPIWPQMNWMMYQGLSRYGFAQVARTVKDDFLQLVSEFGFFEYFDPRKKDPSQLNKGLGGNHFSWTAACFLDLIYSP